MPPRGAERWRAPPSSDGYVCRGRTILYGHVVAGWGETLVRPRGGKSFSRAGAASRLRGSEPTPRPKGAYVGPVSASATLCATLSSDNVRGRLRMPKRTRTGKGRGRGGSHTKGETTLEAPQTPLGRGHYRKFLKKRFPERFSEKCAGVAAARWEEKGSGARRQLGRRSIRQFFSAVGFVQKNGRRIVLERMWQRERAGGLWERVITPTF